MTYRQLLATNQFLNSSCCFELMVEFLLLMFMSLLVASLNPTHESGVPSRSATFNQTILPFLKYIFQTATASIESNFLVVATCCMPSYSDLYMINNIKLRIVPFKHYIWKPLKNIHTFQLNCLPTVLPIEQPDQD